MISFLNLPNSDEFATPLDVPLSFLPLITFPCSSTVRFANLALLGCHSLISSLK